MPKHSLFIFLMLLVWKNIDLKSSFSMISNH